MAAIGKVAAVFTASTGGLSAGVRAAANAFRSLGGDASTLQASFRTLQSISGQAFGDIGPASAGAASALSGLMASAERLQASFAAQSLSAEGFAASMASLTSQASGLAATFSRGAAVTRLTATASETYRARVTELNQLLRSGAISEETFNRAVQQAAAEMRKAGESSGTMANGLAGIQTRLTGLLALDIIGYLSSFVSSITSTVGSLVRMGQAEAGVIDKTSKMAARLGITYGEMAGLSLAAAQNGISLDSMRDAMTKVDVAFVRAARGSKQAAAALASVGLSVADLNGMSSTDRFEAVSEAIGKLPTEAERAAAAIALFGRSGADLLPMFDGGAEAVGKAREEAEKLGLALTNQQGMNVREMVSAFETAKAAISGIVQQVVAYLSPAISGIVKQFNQFIMNIGGANIGQAIGDGIMAGAEFLAGVADWVVENFGSAFEYLYNVVKQFLSTTTIFSRGISFMAGVVRAYMAAYTGFASVIGMVVDRLLDAAIAVQGALGMDTSTLESFSKANETATAIMQAEFKKNLDASAENFSNAFASDITAGSEEALGPWRAWVRGFRDEAKAAAAQIGESKATPVEVKQEVKLDIAQAVKAVDSRSKEGVAEMFRIMRGDTGNIQERQLQALEEIAENTGGGDDLYPFAFAGG